MVFSYVTLLCLFLLIVILFFHCLFSKKNRLSGTLPPGKTGWPVIGETFEFLSTGWKGHPEKFIFNRMNKYSSNVIKTHLVGEKSLLFCGAAANKFLFSNENKLVQGWWPRSVDKIFSNRTQASSKEAAIKVRKLLPYFLKPEALIRYIGIMDEITEGHFVSCWENKDEVVVLPLAQLHTFRLAIRLFVSIEDPNHVAKFANRFSEIGAGVIAMPIDLPGTSFHRAIKGSNFVRKELLSIIKQRKIDLGEGKASSTQDILSHMLLTSDESGKFMSELEIADNILGLLLAGQDTISSTCTSIAKFLAELPEIYEEVYKEQMEIADSKAAGELLNWNDIQKMKYSWNVACEVLRLAPPIQGAFREVLVDFMFNGFLIPKGWKIYWSTYSTQRNSECFSEPLKFDPLRFEKGGFAPYTFVPFGGGPRMCPGNEYARIVILVFMHHLVKRFKYEKVIHDEKFFVSTTMAPANGLPVRLYPHGKALRSV